MPMGRSSGGVRSRPDWAAPEGWLQSDGSTVPHASSLSTRLKYNLVLARNGTSSERSECGGECVLSGDTASAKASPDGAQPTPGGLEELSSLEELTYTGQ